MCPINTLKRITIKCAVQDDYFFKRARPPFHNLKKKENNFVFPHTIILYSSSDPKKQI